MYSIIENLDSRFDKTCNDNPTVSIKYIPCVTEYILFADKRRNIRLLITQCVTIILFEP